MFNRKLTPLVPMVGLAALVIFINSSQSQEKVQQKKGSKLGGYEKPPAANDIPDHLYDIILGRPTDRGVTVRVLANDRLNGRIVFGNETKRASTTTPVVRLIPGEPADFVIDSLEADVRCFYHFEYRRGEDSPFGKSDEYSFHTQRAPKQSFTFTVQSDSHLDENTSSAVYQRTLRNVLNDNPDFHLELGDTFMVDKYVRPEISLGQYLAQRYYLGQACHSVPFFFVLGNHDGEGGDRGSMVWPTQTRKRFFPNPSPNDFYAGNRANEPSIGFVENYYSWKWGDGLFLVLDPFRYTTKQTRNRGEGKKKGDGNNARNEVWDGWDRTLGKEQYDWLKTTLQKSSAKYKFVFLHHLSGGIDRSGRGGIEVVPYFEWGGKNLEGKNEFEQRRPGWGLPIHALLTKYQVSIVFHGHDHLFVKQDLDGIVYQEVPQPGHLRLGNVRSAAEYGYIHGEIQPSSGHLRINVSSDSTRVDYVRSYLPDQETSERKNGDASYSYLIQRKD